MVFKSLIRLSRPYRPAPRVRPTRPSATPGTATTVPVRRRSGPPTLRHRSGRPILPPVLSSRPPRTPLPPAPFLDHLEARIIYEDARILCFDKPAGIALQGAHGSTARIRFDDLLDRLKQREGTEEGEEGGDRGVFPVHRLDKNVTGVLVFSKQKGAAREMSKRFERHEVLREYLAVVHRRMDRGLTGVVANRLRTDEDRVSVVESNDKGVFTEGKDAVTRWTVLDSCPTHSLLKLVPSTGRKHQLRMHCAEGLDAPIVGDFKYGPNAPHHQIWKELPDEILLHSFKIEFYTWAKDGKRNTIQASVDPSKAFARFCSLVGLDLSIIRPAVSTLTASNSTMAESTATVEETPVV